ncbi:Serine/threonine-protein kinase WNK4 [Labeo rohita]|uniref:non-specific serine/threonine protein kinase n=1 Tax=Labeo rohita TaxID=84645 RepID=A0ABQ8MX63_LABRO|nr:Serine/threonine-protein kinase WNK4 [Labeo rohita]
MTFPLSNVNLPSLSPSSLFQGMKPDSFYKVKVPELKEIIEGCIRMNKDERYTIQDLLEHTFFQENNGVRVELAEEDDMVKSGLKLWLRMDDTKKLHGKYKDNNAIEFLFELYKDVPEEVAQEMVVLGFVCEADYKLVAKAIRDRVTAIKRQREKLRRQEEPEPSLEAEPSVSNPPTPKPPVETPVSTSTQTPPTVTVSGPVSLPANESLDSGFNASFATEPEEPDADQRQHFNIRHASYSSATIICKLHTNKLLSSCLVELWFPWQLTVRRMDISAPPGFRNRQKFEVLWQTNPPQLHNQPVELLNYASDVTSGLSDGNEGLSERGGKGQSKRTGTKLLRKRARSRLRITGLSDKVDRVVECQLQTHNSKMVHNEFILPGEREGFIHRMRDIIRRAEALMRREPLEPLGPRDNAHYAAASIGPVTRGSSPTLSADFYVDPDAVPPVRPLRSSQTYQASTPNYPQYSHPDVLPHLLPNQMSAMPPQLPKPTYVHNTHFTYSYQMDHGSLNSPLNPSPLTRVPSNPNFFSSSSSSSVVSPVQQSVEMPPQGETNTLPLPVAPPPGPQAPGMWPPPSQQPFISLANVLSLAMNFAQSFIPPGSIPQGFHPQMTPQPGYGPMYPAQHASMSNPDPPYHQGAQSGQYMDMYQYPDAHMQIPAPVPEPQDGSQRASPPVVPLREMRIPEIKQPISAIPSSSPGSRSSPLVESQSNPTGQLRERADSSASSSRTPSSTSSPASSTSPSPQNTVSSPVPRSSPTLSMSLAVSETNSIAAKSRLSPISEEKKSIVTVGRFQVSPSKEIPIPTPSPTPSLTPTPTPTATPTSTSISTQTCSVTVPQATPPAHNSQSDSSTDIQVESESSPSSLNESPPLIQTPNEALGSSDSAPLWTGEPKTPDRKVVEPDEGRGGEEGEEVEEETERRRRRISVSLLDSSAGSPQFNLNQPWMSYTRSASYASSDETESEDEGMYEELQELRERHVAEVQALQATQKQEIEELYKRMGKVPPPGIVSPAAMLSSRQRRLSKSGGYSSSRRNSLQRLDILPPTGIMRKNSVSGSSSGSQERTSKGVTFASDYARIKPFGLRTPLLMD